MKTTVDHMALERELSQIEQQFALTFDQVLSMSKEFKQEMQLGLSRQKGQLKMLPSYLSRPSGLEKGLFLAMDFGGTNVRALLMELGGDKNLFIRDKIAVPLKSQGHHDYTASTCGSLELFDFLTENIAKLRITKDHLPLGLTFSFPSRQESLRDAYLINWTKEIQTQGVVGRNIASMLDLSLQRRGLNNVKTVAIINDTVGTFLSSAYRNSNTAIGSICGTGHNSCYLQPNFSPQEESVIINMESGNFKPSYYTSFDQALDSASSQPGFQKLEKMVSGHYLGELLRLLILHFYRQGLVFHNQNLPLEPYSLYAKDLSQLLADESSALLSIETWAKERLFVKTIKTERLVLQNLARLLANRSAQLVAASFLGTINHIDPQGLLPHHIGIDGSLFENMPGYASAINQTLTKAKKNGSPDVTLGLTKDGSGLGAAIAASMAVKTTST